ncbi:MAG: hypothetical protein ACRD0S_13320, partial [Acidimicrobiales bacterium]
MTSAAVALVLVLAAAALLGLPVQPAAQAQPAGCRVLLNGAPVSDYARRSGPLVLDVEDSLIVQGVSRAPSSFLRFAIRFPFLTRT